METIPIKMYFLVRIFQAIESVKLTSFLIWKRETVKVQFPNMDFPSQWSASVCVNLTSFLIWKRGSIKVQSFVWIAKAK